MSLWTQSDAAAGAPKHPGVAAVGNASGSSLFGNTQIAAFNTGSREAVGIFGVDTTEQRVSASGNTHPQHSGWVLVTRGTGPITSITANTNSVATNTYLTFTGGGTGAIQANASVVVNVNNYIVRVELNEATGFIGGSYLVAPTITQVGNATFTITMGGRAGRVQTETLVATGTIGASGTADASDDAIFPDA
jgi:hypothetical protein